MLMMVTSYCCRLFLTPSVWIPLASNCPTLWEKRGGESSKKAIQVHSRPASDVGRLARTLATFCRRSQQTRQSPTPAAIL